MNPIRNALLLLTLIASPLFPIQNLTADLDEAKALYRQGRFGQTVARLQTILLRLENAEEPRDRSIQEEAYLYFGLAYVALDDPDGARSAFVSLLRLAPERRLDPEVHAPKVIALFEEARLQARETAPPSDASIRTTTTSTPEAEPSAAPPVQTRSASRLGWTLLGAGAGAGAVAAATGWASASTTTTSIPPVTTTTSVPSAVEVDARMNGLKRGTFSCSQSIVLSIDVINNSDSLLRIDGFDIGMNSTSAECITHRPALDGTVGMDALPGARVQIRQADLAGDLCRSPGRIPGCGWRAVVVVMTSRGAFENEVQFSTIP